jgi:hypothetical protein
VIAQAAAEALSRFTGRRPVRLLGVRAQFEKGARLKRTNRTGHRPPLATRTRSGTRTSCRNSERHKTTLRITALAA